MGPECSLPHSQMPATCPYPEPSRSIPCPHIPLSEYFNIILLSTPGSPKLLIPSIYLRAYLLTPWSRVLLEKLLVSQLVKKFHPFYGTRKFITAITTARHLSLFWASSIQSIPPHPTSWRSIFLLYFHLPLGLPSGLFPSVFPTKTLYTPLLSSIRPTCSVHLILLENIGNTNLIPDWLWFSISGEWMVREYIFIYCLLPKCIVDKWIGGVTDPEIHW